MKDALFTNERFVKQTTGISDNLAGKYLLPSIREAQEQGLRSILGDCLFLKVRKLIADEVIGSTENAAYKALVDHCQYYLAYLSVVEVTNKVSYKIGNFGVAKSQDENLQVASYDEITKQQFYYQTKVDDYCLKFQNWIIENRKDYPELTECQCNKIRSNLYASASCGIWLGGARGKSRRR